MRLAAVIVVTLALVGCSGGAHPQADRSSSTTSRPVAATTTTATTLPPLSVVWSQAGSGDTTTAVVTVPGGLWQLLWSYDCSALARGGYLYVSAYTEAAALVHEMDQEGKGSNSGAATYQDGPGRFSFEVDSNCKWKLQVAS